MLRKFNECPGWIKLRRSKPECIPSGFAADSGHSTAARAPVGGACGRNSRTNPELVPDKQRAPCPDPGALRLAPSNHFPHPTFFTPGLLLDRRRPSVTGRRFYLVRAACFRSTCRSRSHRGRDTNSAQIIPRATDSLCPLTSPRAAFSVEGRHQQAGCTVPGPPSNQQVRPTP
jgi:hypothetical protein